MNPPKWDQENKDFDLWVREIKAWKISTATVSGLKGVHALQLVLHFPEGSEIRNQLFETFDTEEMKGDDGWNRVIDHMKQYYSKDDTIAAFHTFKEFRFFSRKPDQDIDSYIMEYDL